MRKRCLSLVIAVALLATMLVFPVSAAVPGGDVVYPMYEIASCPGCDRSVRVRVIHDNYSMQEGPCELGGAMVHTHTYDIYIKKTVCSDCGEMTIDVYGTKYCGGEIIRWEYDG